MTSFGHIVATILENQVHIALAVQHADATDDVWVAQGVRQKAELLVDALHLRALTCGLRALSAVKRAPPHVLGASRARPPGAWC